MSRSSETPTAPNGKSLLYVQLALENQHHADVLSKLRTKRKLFTPESESLWEGAFTLNEEAKRFTNEALRYGQLLFCFKGTTVLQQGGAA